MQKETDVASWKNKIENSVLFRMHFKGQNKTSRFSIKSLLWLGDGDSLVVNSSLERASLKKNK